MGFYFKGRQSHDKSVKPPDNHQINFSAKITPKEGAHVKPIDSKTGHDMPKGS
jgi:hypothetical protein